MAEVRAAVGDLGLWSASRVAAALGVSVGTLANWRAKKKGPPSVKVGRVVWYREVSVRGWLEREER